MQKESIKNVGKKVAVIALSCSMALANVTLTPLRAMAEERDVEHAEEVFTDFLNVSGGDGQYVKNGEGDFTVHHNGGNNRLLSDIHANAFVYETKMKIHEGDRGSLVFGAQRQKHDDPGSFFGLEISANNRNINVKMFQDNGPGGELVPSTTVLEDVDTTQEIAVKLIVDNRKDIQLYVNGQRANIHVSRNFKKYYQGGFIGALTWQSKVSFSGIKVTKSADAVNKFETNLAGFDALGNQWIKTEDGLYSSGDGDNFAMSSTSGTDFIYEADVTLQPTGAASLIFRSSDSGDRSYVANISRQDKNVRIFKFPGGVDVGGAVLPDPGKEDYHLRIEAVGSSLRYYVDGQLLVVGNDSTYTSGKFGLLTNNTTAIYQNLNQKEVAKDSYPVLTGLEFEGEGSILSPSFSESNTVYTLYIPRSAPAIKVKARSDADSISVRAVDVQGNVVMEEIVLKSGITSPSLPLPSGASNLFVKTTKGDISVETLVKVNKMYSAEELSKEAFRPQFHFSPETNFMNDPNGLVYDPSNETWHMFFQKQPGVGWVNNQAWGHAQSKDLVSWQEMPIAMDVDELGFIFSGSAVVDEDNTSGFFSDNKAGESKLVAIFTHHGHGTQVQSIAYSKDHGLTWTKYEGNPVIPNPGGTPYSGDFRDPKVFRYDNTWYMVAAGGRGRLFASEDLKSWDHVEDFFFADGRELHSECPDLFPLAVDGDGKQKWVYSGGGEFYVIGDFVKQADGYYHFVAETNEIQAPNGRTNMYATQSYYNDPTGQNRKMLVSWLQDYSAPDSIPQKGWNGVQSIPLETKLKTVDGKEIVTHYPVDEIKQLRGDILFETGKQVVNEGDSNILRGVAGRIYDIEAEFTLGSAKEFGFHLRTGEGEKIVFTYQKDTKKMVLDKRASGAAYNNVIDWELLPMEGNRISMRILVDEGVIDTFGNEGEATISDLCFPSADSVGMEFFAKGGDVQVDRMKIYDMKSMFTGDSVRDQLKADIAFTAPSQVEVNEVFTVDAYAYPSNAENKELEWTFGDGLVLLAEADGRVTLRADKAGTYEIIVKTKDGRLEKRIMIKAITSVFESNLIGWKETSGSWQKTETGIQGNNMGIGDSFYVSSASLKAQEAFTYEGDVHLEQGAAAGLLFGAGKKDNPAGNWYCINVEKGDKNVAKLFKNTGQEDWSIEHTLTEEEKAIKDYHFKVVYDGKGKLQYFLNGTLIAEKTDVVFGGGYVGLNTFQSNATFNNVTLKTESPIASIVSTFEDKEVKKGSSLDDLKATLRTHVIVKQEDGIELSVPIVWDTSKVDMQKAGAYKVVGNIAGTELKAMFTVHVTEISLVALDPASLAVQAIEGVSAAHVFQELKKDVTAIYSDGSRAVLTVLDWDVSEVDFNKAGTYLGYGYLDAKRTLKIDIHITITKKDAPMGDRELHNEDKTVRVSGKLPSDVTLKTTMISEQDFIGKLKDATYMDSHVVLSAWDIRLLQKDAIYVADGELRISLALSPEWKNFSLIYVDDQGVLHDVKYQIEKGYIVFQTSHLSTFAIVMNKDVKDEVEDEEKETITGSEEDKTNQDVNTADATHTSLWMTLLSLAGIGVWFARGKRRKTKE